MKELFYDLETTGIDKSVHAIHQFSGKLLIDGVVVEVFDFKMRPHPGALIDAKALEVSRITAEQLAAYEHDHMEIYRRFISTLAKYCNKFDKKDKIFLAGYNVASFDNDFLRKWFERCGDVYFGSWFWSVPLDVIILAGQYLKQERHAMKDFKLHTVAAQLGIAVDETRLHDATYDIDLTIAIYQEIHYPSLSI